MARPRSQEAHRKVLDAALALFAEHGIEAASMDAIAYASGVSKATIYKYWSNKDALVLEALSHLFGTDKTVPVPDTGDLHADLISRLSHDPGNKQLRDRIMPHVIAYATGNQEFGKAWRNRAMQPIITALMAWLDREEQRGTLQTGIDREIAIALLVGPIMLRNIFHRTAPRSKTPWAKGLEAAIAKSFLAVHATPSAPATRKHTGANSLAS